MSSIYAGKGIFDAYIIINPSTYYQAFNFNTTNFGTFAYNGTLVLNGGEVQSWENNPDNNQEAYMHYRIYEQGTSAPTFTAMHLNGSYTCMPPPQNCIGNYGDEKRDITNANLNLISLVPNASTDKTYKIEVYFRTTGSGESFYSNNGANFSATFIKMAQPLPVKLKNLDVSRKSSVNYLQWITATETNNDYFEVQHSNDGSNFTDVGFVKGHGNSNTERNYSFEHAVSSGKVSYYRLKQVDFDGRYEYSSIVSVRSDGKRSEESIIIAPNPVTDVVNVFGLEDDATYRITDFAGKQYLSGMIIPGQTLDVADLKPGFYIVTIQNGAATSSSKMVKK